MASAFPSSIPAPLATGDIVSLVQPHSIVIPPPPRTRSRRRLDQSPTAPARALTLSESRISSVFEEGFDDAQSSLTPSETAAFLPRRSLTRRLWLRVRAAFHK